MLSTIDVSLRHCAYGRYFELTSVTPSAPEMEVSRIRPSASPEMKVGTATDNLGRVRVQRDEMLGLAD